MGLILELMWLLQNPTLDLTFGVGTILFLTLEATQ